MLEKTEIPLIPDGYPLVVAMNALMDAVKSVSQVINNKKKAVSVELKEVMLKSSWSGVMAALALLLDTCADERTTSMILESHQTYIYLCGKLGMTSPRDAFITSLCKACLPPRYAMSLITQRGPTKTQAAASTAGASLASPPSSSSPVVSRTDRSHGRATNEGAPPPHIMPTASSSTPLSSGGQTDAHSLRHLGARKKFNLSEIGVGSGASGGGGGAGGMAGGVAAEGVAMVGGTSSHMRISGSGSSISGGALIGGALTPVKEREQSSLLTVKNLQCIETLLSIIDHHGNYLDTAWHLIMTAVQHVVEVFGLLPLSSGGFKQSGLSENSSLALVNVDKKKELSEVSEKLANLFKGSKSLSDSGVIHLISALSQLSTNSLQGSQSKEVGMFPIAALLEVGNVNLNRVELIWSPITTHLSEACSVGFPSLRAFAAEALTLLIRTSLENYSEEKIQLVLLRPLESMTRVPHSDVRQKQMDCITHILHSSGHSLGSSWSIILEVISSATRLQNENLVRAGFQSLQLVITDFLPSIPPSCVPSCVEVGGQYGLQTMDMNISLTSIGILWNMADYLFQNKATLQDNLELLKSQTSKSSQTSLHAAFVKKIQSSSLTVFDSLWMLLFKHLSDLCIDERSAVRKSACQTLFSTISAHGTLLQKETWQEVLWKVMFPLLGKVSEKTGSASTSSFQTAIMIHHSRDTAQKQWAETQVLTLTGTARLIQTRWFTLVALDGFEKAWSSFLDIIQTCALSASTEVSIAAMKSFHTIIDPQTPSPSPRSSIVGRHSRSPSREITPPPSLSADNSEHVLTPSSSATSLSLANKQSQMDKLPQEKKNAIWSKAWGTWSTIGNKCVCKRLPSAEQIRTLLKSSKTEEIDRFFRIVPSQAFLVHLLQIFPHIYLQLRKTFDKAQFEVLSSILQASLLMPTSKDVSPFLVPSSNENKMTNAQRLILKCYSIVYTVENVVDPEKTDEGENLKDLSSSAVNSLLRTRKIENIDMRRKIELNSESCPECVALYPNVLSELLKCVAYASRSLEDSIPNQLGIPPMRSPVMSVNYMPFGLGALSLAVQFYVGCVQAGMALPRATPHSFLKTLHVPLKLKHSCPLPTVWISSIEALLLMLETALPSVLKSKGGEELEFWRELAAVLEDFLFNEVPDGVQLTAEQLREHEAIDIKVIELIKRDILPVSKQTPDEFLNRLTSILNRGSIHSATDNIDGPGVGGAGGGVSSRRSAIPFRENFARVCFQALLRFSFINSQEATIASDSTSQLALNALLKRCEEVLLKYADDERLSGNCPLPRSRMNEVSLVLKSVTVLISSLKEAQKSSAANIDPGIWYHVGQLFPALVQCVTCTSLDVRQALKEALSQFSDLMQPFPSPKPSTGSR